MSGRRWTGKTWTRNDCECAACPGVGLEIGGDSSDAVQLRNVREHIMRSAGKKRNYQQITSSLLSGVTSRPLQQVVQGTTIDRPKAVGVVIGSIVAVKNP